MRPIGAGGPVCSERSPPVLFKAPPKGSVRRAERPAARDARGVCGLSRRILPTDLFHPFRGAPDSATLASSKPTKISRKTKADRGGNVQELAIPNVAPAAFAYQQRGESRRPYFSVRVQTPPQSGGGAGCRYFRHSPPC